MEAFIASNNFDLVCLSGNLLDSTIPNDDINIQINGYSLLRADHPNDIKRRGVCIYSLRQSHDELERFWVNFDLLLSNINDLHPTCSIVLGDFNAKCSKWCASDRNNSAGIELDNITTTSGYNQMIDKPTHYINESSSCIDLIFSSNVNLTKNCGVEQSLYETYHHNIIYETLNFNVPLLPLYLREIWDYKNANIECIQKSIYNFDWIRAFQNRNCNEKCKILSETLLNIFHNFIPHKIKKIYYETPEWINRSIKLSLKK